MKKSYLSICLFGLLAVGTGSIAFSKTITKSVKAAASSDNRIVLGRYAVTQGTVGKTKCYISKDDVPFVISTGRIVYSEGAGSYVVSSVNHIVLPPPTPSFFFYATPAYPEIVEIKTIYNDWSSILFMLDQVEKAARTYLSVAHCEIHDPNLLSLIYLRSVNRRYASLRNSDEFDSWTYCAGNGNLAESFIASFKDDKTHGLNPLEFFSHFVSSQDANTDLYGDYSNSTNFAYNVSPNDYLFENRGFDLIHFFAAANAFYYDSQYIVFPHGELLLDTLTSWGGDLMEGCAYADDERRDKGKNYTSFEDVLSGVDSPCSWGDFYGDIDGANFVYQGLKQNKTLVNSLLLIMSYDNSSRFSHFINDAYFGNSPESTFRYCSESMLNNNTSPMTDFGGQSIGGLNPYKFLLNNQGGYPDGEFRKVFSSSFSSYVISQYA